MNRCGAFEGHKARVLGCVNAILTVVLIVSLLIAEPPTIQADAIVSGTISSDTTWTAANSPYIIVGDIEVAEGVTLTIEAGVTLKLDSGKKLEVGGGLIAQGTADSLITFTSNQPVPAAGDWGNIEFTSTAMITTMDAAGNYVSGSVLEYCVVEYAGADAYFAIDARSLLIDHCLVSNNDATGMSNVGTADAPARMTNTTVSGNSGKSEYGNSGGGIYAVYSIVSGNTVTRNSGGIYCAGGGIYARDSTVSGNIVTFNDLAQRSPGGGIYALNSTVSGNTVNGNRCGGYSGAGGGIWASSCTVTGNTVTGNYGVGAGGGIYAHDSTVRNNTVISNTVWARIGGYSEGGGISADGCLVTGNTVSGNLSRNWAGDDFGGGIHAYDSTVRNNTISSNSTGGSGGGLAVAVSDSGHTTLSGNTIVSNTADIAGGGIYVSAFYGLGGSVDASNDLIANNTSPSEGVHLSGGELTARHWTLVNNGSYALTTDGGSATLTNTIVATHTVAGFWGSDITADHTLFFNSGTPCGGGASCTNSISGDPAFVNPAAFDYHLTSGSAAIDVGVDAGVETDIDGEPRPYQIPDLGADEYWPPGVLRYLYLPLIMRHH